MLEGPPKEALPAAARPWLEMTVWKEPWVNTAREVSVPATPMPCRPPRAGPEVRAGPGELLRGAAAPAAGSAWDRAEAGTHAGGGSAPLDRLTVEPRETPTPAAARGHPAVRTKPDKKAGPRLNASRSLHAHTGPQGPGAPRGSQGPPGPGKTSPCS